MVGWLILTPLVSYADEITINLTPEIAFVDTVVQVETTTAYTITTTTGPRTEVVNSVTVEREAWVDSWISLYRGVAVEGGTVIAQDDDSNHNTQTNYYASRLSGTLTPDTYTIRATSYDFIVANQRPIGTYTLSSNLIDLPEPIVEEPVVVPPVSIVVQPVLTPEIVIPYIPPQIIVIDTSPEPITTIEQPTQQPIGEVVLDSEVPVPVVEPSVPENPEQLIPVIEPESQSEEPIDTPIVNEEPNTPSEENQGPITVAELETLVDNLVMGGVVTSQDSVQILDALSQDGEITQTEVNNLSEQLSTDGTFTESERELVAEALIESAEGQAVTVEAIAEAGITLADLPPSTPVEVRQDSNGNEVIVIAEVAAALVILESPVELLSTIFSDPAQALLAISSIGADMSDEERSESEQTIVAAVIVSGIAVQSATTAALAGSVSYRRRL